jgi:TetR/AcrR family tetracycline transcriptional repressor
LTRVPRPKVPLISKRTVYEAALRLIDEDGLAAVSTRRLGVEIGVNGTSLYHHFKSMDEVLAGAAGLALQDVRTPDDEADWREWFPDNAMRTRQVLLNHPNLIALLLDRRRYGIGERGQDATVRRLLSEGVPLAAITPLMVTFELLAIGSALQDTQSNGPGAHELDELYPDLARARKASGLAGEELLRAVMQSITDTILAAAAAPKTRRPATPRNRPKAAPKTAPKTPGTTAKAAPKKAAARTAATKLAKAAPTAKRPHRRGNA